MLNKRQEKFRADYKKRTQEEIINSLDVGMITLRNIKNAITKVLHEDGYLGVSETKEV